MNRGKHDYFDTEDRKRFADLVTKECTQTINAVEQRELELLARIRSLSTPGLTRLWKRIEKQNEQTIELMKQITKLAKQKSCK
jgi:hypothetical protein